MTESVVLECGTNSTKGTKCGGLKGCPIRIRPGFLLQSATNCDEGMPDDEDAMMASSRM